MYPGIFAEHNASFLKFPSLHFCFDVPESAHTLLVVDVHAVVSVSSEEHIAQAWQAALLASENVVPATHAAHCVSTLAVHADVCP